MLNRRDQRTLYRMRGGGTVSFRDLLHLVESFGFSMTRQRGSHCIYKHQNVPGALVLQPKGTDAKKYQIRQVLDMLEASGLLDRRP